MNRRGLRARLGRVFAAQVAVIGLATVVGVYVTRVVVEDLLTRRALDLEAEHFWQLADADPAQPLPNTANLRGYLAAPGSPPPPDDLAGLEPGFGRRPVDGRDRLVHVSERRGRRLYLVFEEDSVSDLTFYFGLLPLSVVLLLMYVLLFVAYRWSHRALSPVVRLARQLGEVDFESTGRVRVDLGPLRDTADAELAAMIEALDQLAARVDAAIERERVFTRDAGHELRTPVAVLKGSLDLLDRDDRDRPERERETLSRMRRTVDDMEALLETLLLLARGEVVPGAEETVVNDVAASEIGVLAAQAARVGDAVCLDEREELRVRAPARVVRIVFGNLLRNAVNHTRGGRIDVIVTADSLTVEDTGSGMSEAQLANAFEPFYRADDSRRGTEGHGLGLSIVRRLSRQFGWQITARSQPGQGTSMTIRFP